MTSFSERLMAHLETIGYKPYDIWKWFKPLEKEERLSEQYIYKICRGEKDPKDETTIRKLSTVEWLGLDYHTLMAWYLYSKYGETGVKRIKDELGKVLDER